MLARRIDITDSGMIKTNFRFQRPVLLDIICGMEGQSIETSSDYMSPPFLVAYSVAALIVLIFVS